MGPFAVALPVTTRRTRNHGNVRNTQNISRNPTSLPLQLLGSTGGESFTFSQESLAVITTMPRILVLGSIIETLEIWMQNISRKFHKKLDSEICLEKRWMEVRRAKKKGFDIEMAELRRESHVQFH